MRWLRAIRSCIHSSPDDEILVIDLHVRRGERDGAQSRSDVSARPTLLNHGHVPLQTSMDALYGAGAVGLLQFILNYRWVRALIACVCGVVRK